MPVSCKNIEVTDISSKLVRELLIFFAHFKASKDSSLLSRSGISDISRSVRCARLIFIVLFALKFCLKEIRSFNYEAARGIHRRAGRNAGGKRRDYNKLCSRSSTRTAKEETVAGDTSMHHSKTCCPRQLCAGLEN